MRRLCPWDSSGKNIEVGCHALLQGIFLTQGLNLHLLRLLHCRWILHHWATGEACSLSKTSQNTRNNKIYASFFSHIEHRIYGWFFFSISFHSVGCHPQKERSIYSHVKSPYLPVFNEVNVKESYDCNFSLRKTWRPKLVGWEKVSHLNMLLVAARTIWNLTAFLVSDCWQKRGILINFAHKKPPASSRIQRIVLFLVVKLQFIERYFHACFSLGENLLFCKPTF